MHPIWYNKSENNIQPTYTKRVNADGFAKKGEV
jgi:hypothetical protein